MFQLLIIPSFIDAYLDGSDTWRPMSTTSFLEVLWFLRDFPSTIAPLAYLSFVAKVTNAWSAKREMN